MSERRVEHDAFGAIDVPADRYWGAQTQRALHVFDVGEERFPTALVHAFALQKIAALRANLRLGSIPSSIAAPIEQAATELH